MPDELLFQVSTPLKFSVRVTHPYWEYIVTIKHPVMVGREEDVKDALQNPQEIRVSRSDSNVYLFYKREKIERWVCVVVKRLNGEGFLITTYRTEAIKEGVKIWPK